MQTHERIRWLKNHPVWQYPAKLPFDQYNRDLLKIENYPDHLIDNTGTPYIVVPMGGFNECVDIEVVLVNPLTGSIDEDEDLNTELHVWLEGGQWEDMSTWENYHETVWTEHNKWAATHDLRLDCGGKTIVEALLNLADLVEEHYGNDGPFRLADGTWLVEV
jgi:hypothetical protein